MKRRMIVFWHLVIFFYGCTYQNAGQIEATQSPTATFSTSMPTTSAPLSFIRPTVYQTLDPFTVSGKVVFRNRAHGDGFTMMDADGTNEVTINITNKDELFDVISSPMRWSPNGRQLAFGCQNEEATIYGLCVLNLAEYFSGSPNSRFLQIIRLPERYLHLYPYGLRINIDSLEWTASSKQIVITSPLCIVDVSESQTSCTNEALSGFNDADRWTIENARAALPTKEENTWLIFSHRDKSSGTTTSIYQVLWDVKEVFQLALSRCSGSEMGISNDGAKLATDKGIINLKDLSCLEYSRTLDLIDPNLLPPLVNFTQGHFAYLSDRGYPPRQSFSWSPDDRYIAMTVFYKNILRENDFNDQSGIFYFDTQTGALLPIKVKYSSMDFSEDIYATPNWYACDDLENVCELYK